MKANFKFFLSFLYMISTAYLPHQAFAAGGEGDQCKQTSQKSKDLCQSNIEAARGMGQLINAQGQQAAEGAGAEKMGDVLKQGTQAQSANAGEAINSCQTAQNDCRTQCEQLKSQFDSAKTSQPPYVINNVPQQSTIQQQEQAFQQGNQLCEDEINSQLASLGQQQGDLNQAATQSEDTRAAADTGGSKNSGSGGMGGLGAGLLGALAGGLAGYMLGKKKKEKDEADENPVNEDGTVDCSKSGAEAYSDCNEHFATQCLSSLTSDECKAFSGRYCSSSGTASSTTASSSSPNTSSSGIIIASASDKDIKGEGVGTQFCFTAQATGFCSTSGRESCPSCLQLQTNQLEACQNNPALCLAQNDPTSIEAAKKTCPSDPLFSNPEYASGGGSQVPNSESLADPVLPAQYASSFDSASTASASGEITDVAGSGYNGYANGYAVGSDSNQLGSGGRGPSDSASTTHSILPSGVRVASAGAGAGNRNPTSVGGVMGPSLFSMNSSLYEQQCRQGRLAHCSR